VSESSKLADLAAEALKRGRRHPRYPWWSQLDLNKLGQPKATLHNTLVVLREHPAWAGLYELDEFANQIRLTREPPYGGSARELAERDAAELAAWLGNPAEIGMPVTSGLALEAITTIAARHAVHPVRQYLDGLTWDGVERLPTVLPDWFEAPGNPYTERVGLCWLTSAVARVMCPGCKVDFMVVLEGGQGIGKSSAVRELFGAPWYAEQTESPQSKDFYQVLAGRWVLEIGEMQSFAKADLARVKQAITTQDDVYRPSYGRVARRFPRQSIFVGTTNEDEYLKDYTGARRFLPVRCRSANVRGLIAMRDQLWAEAVERWRQGFEFWVLPPEARAEQEARYQHDSWIDPIREWVEGRGPPTAYPMGAPIGPLARTSVHETMTRALGVELAKHTRQDQMRVGTVLRLLGFERQRVRGPDGGLIWGYVRKASPP
jgi:predicted P-loop ATPase